MFPALSAIHDISPEVNCLKNGYLKKAIWHEKEHWQVVNLHSLSPLKIELSSASTSIHVIIQFSSRSIIAHRSFVESEVIKKCRIFMAIHGDYG